MATGNIQKVRLLLEGREVPLITASIHGKENAPLTAIIDLVPLSIIKQIRPRTLAQIFVRDDLLFGDTDFHVAFEGDVIGRGFKKNSNGERSFQITAVDFSQYWTETKTYVYNTNYAVGRLSQLSTDYGAPLIETEVKFTGARSFSSEDTASSLMIRKLLAASNKDILAGIVKAVKEIVQINYYYSNVYSRLRITDRIVAQSSGGLQQFFNVILTEDFLTNFMGTHGGLTSVMEVLTNIMGLVFHEYVSVPFPSITDSGVIQNFIFFPDCYSLPPPKCNVIFPNSVVEFNFSDDFTAAPTRMMYRYSSVNFTGAGAGASLQTTVPCKYYPDSFSDFMYSQKQATYSSPRSLLDPADIYVGTDYSQVNYGGSNKGAQGGVALSPTLRDGDFLTNDEAIRGIIPEVENFPPAIAALKDQTSLAKGTFFQTIGEYTFYKKRFSARVCSAQLRFSPYLVPGFNALVLDNSDANHTIIAKLPEVIHQLSNAGHSTTATFGYARDFDEVDALSGSSGEPPCPAWFDPSVFGQQGDDNTVPANFTAETAYLQQGKFISQTEVTARNAITGTTTYSLLNSFYQQLLVCDAVTDNGTNGSQLVSLRGAASYLTSTYSKLDKTPSARDAWIQDYNYRPVPTMAQTMAFMGARVTTGDSIVPTLDSIVTGNSAGTVIPAEWAQFEADPGGIAATSTTTGIAGGRFDGDGFPDQPVLNYRRTIIDQYVALLKQQRSFRG